MISHSRHLLSIALWAVGFAVVGWALAPIRDMIVNALPF